MCFSFHSTSDSLLNNDTPCNLAYPMNQWRVWWQWLFGDLISTEDERRWINGHKEYYGRGVAYDQFLRYGREVEPSVVLDGFLFFNSLRHGSKNGGVKDHKSAHRIFVVPVSSLIHIMIELVKLSTFCDGTWSSKWNSDKILWHQLLSFLLFFLFCPSTV
jgi:hypothetical protein